MMVVKQPRSPQTLVMLQQTVCELFALELQAAQASCNAAGERHTLVRVEIDKLLGALREARRQLTDCAARHELPLSCEAEDVATSSVVERLPEGRIPAHRIPHLLSERWRFVGERVTERAAAAADDAVRHLLERIGKRLEKLAHTVVHRTEDGATHGYGGPGDAEAAALDPSA